MFNWISNNKYRFGLILSALFFVLNNLFADSTKAFERHYPSAYAEVVGVGASYSHFYYTCVAVNVICLCAAIIFIFASVENREW